MGFDTPLTIKQLKSWLSERGVPLPIVKDRERAFYVQEYYRVLVNDEIARHQHLSLQELESRLINEFDFVLPVGHSNHDTALDKYASFIVETTKSKSATGRSSVKRTPTMPGKNTPTFTDSPTNFATPVRDGGERGVVPTTPSVSSRIYNNTVTNSPWDPFAPSPSSSPPTARASSLTSPVSPLSLSSSTSSPSTSSSLPLTSSSDYIFSTPPSTPPRSSSFTSPSPTLLSSTSSLYPSSSSSSTVQTFYNDDEEKSYSFAWSMIAIQCLVVVLVFTYLQFKTNPEPFYWVQTQFHYILSLFSSLSVPSTEPSGLPPTPIRSEEL